MLKKENIFNYLLFLVTFTLPMFTRLNNILLGIFILFVIINSIATKGKPGGNFFKQYLPIIIFFALAFVASIINSEELLLKHLEKYLSYILIPFAFWLQQPKTDKEQLVKYTFKGLLYGCLATLVICYGNVIYEIISNEEPLSYFLRWRHLNHDFTNIADTHPAYLGLFIVVSFYYLLIVDKKESTLLKIIFSVIFTLGMIQLASRLAFVLYIFVFVIYFLKTFRNIKKYIVYIILLTCFSVITVFYLGSDYLKERIFSTTSVTEDGRFKRLQVSYDIFKEQPILGFGFGKIEEERNSRYTKKGYVVAAHHSYNAHNQLVEFLSVNGLLGALTYLLVFVFLVYKSLLTKNYLFLFIFTSFFIANITESMMVRIKGIEYFALVGSIFLMDYKRNKLLSPKRKGN